MYPPVDGVSRDDVFLMVFGPGTACAGVFTASRTASDDVDWCRRALVEGKGAARALLVNAGNSNAFTGAFGRAKNAASLEALQETLGVSQSHCFLAATGVIGEPLPSPGYIAASVQGMASSLTSPDWESLARAFMTTDTYPKGAGGTTNLAGTSVSMAGIAKGSGMIAPNMATMLAYAVTDAAIAPNLLQELLQEVTQKSFNSITVDGDTSTSDTFMVFATGASGMPPITSPEDPRYPPFKTLLLEIAQDLAVQIVKDGEGASKFITIEVAGAASDTEARAVGASVANSPLVKTALASSDANWGRVVMAVGNAGVAVDQARLRIWFGDHLVADAGGRAEGYDEGKASAACAKDEIVLRISLGDGPGQATVYTCDLTHAYIDINGAYRT
ncbi:MAG: bifunctional glutamate N-acetyltransferase/amino-acid acetyltransferase ArgJ [Pseudomonadota bacterium]